MITTIPTTHSLTNPGSNIVFATRILFVFVFVVCGLSAFSSAAYAQGSLQLGTIAVANYRGNVIQPADGTTTKTDRPTPI